jgi:hypothetical protein
MEDELKDLMFSWRGFPSFRAAIVCLSKELERYVRFSIRTKQDRESLARIMLRTDAGSVDGIISWFHSERATGTGLGDLRYTILNYDLRSGGLAYTGKPLIEVLS